MEQGPDGSKNEKPLALVEFGVGGHEKEYIVILHDYDLDEYIPGEVEDEIQSALGQEWRVDNRGTRLEIVNNKKFGARDDAVVVTAVKKILAEKGYRFD